MITITIIVLSIGLGLVAALAEHYREQRDNLAAAWIYAHPEDFPDAEE